VADTNRTIEFGRAWKSCFRPQPQVGLALWKGASRPLLAEVTPGLVAGRRLLRHALGAGELELHALVREYCVQFESPSQGADIGAQG